MNTICKLTHKQHEGLPQYKHNMINHPNADNFGWSPAWDYLTTNICNCKSR